MKRQLGAVTGLGMAALFAWPALVGCSAAPGDQESALYEDELIGEATFELTTVPGGAQCLQVIAGSETRNVPVTPATSSSTVHIGKLPTGTLTIEARVYSETCEWVDGATPTWLADAQTVTLRAGVITNLSLTLRPNNPVTGTVNFVGNITHLAAGNTSTALAMGDGTMRMAGELWPVTPATTLTNVTTHMTGVAQVSLASASNTQGCAVKTDGTVWCFGVNTWGQLGAITATSSNGSWVPGLSGIKQVGAGSQHNCALSTEGVVYCWGDNSVGQLGNGTTSSTPSTTPVRQWSGVVDTLAVGDKHTCASVGFDVMCWGQNYYGQLGDGTTTSPAWPTYTRDPAVAATVSLATSAHHTCAVRGDGTVRCWGSNWSGELGDGTNYNRLKPTQVAGITDAVEVATGASHTCVRRLDGTVMCFGDNSFGQLGDATGQKRLLPTVVPGIFGATKIAAGWQHTCALLEDQTVHCWGFNRKGQLANGAYSSAYSPTPVTIK